MSVNKMILIGNLGKDPVVRYDGGKPIVTISLATTTPPEDLGNGIMLPERTEWHTLKLWGKNAELAEKYLRKGHKIYAEGKLRYRIWEDNTAIKRTVAEIWVDSFDILSRNNQ